VICGADLMQTRRSRAGASRAVRLGISLHRSEQESPRASRKDFERACGFGCECGVPPIDRAIYALQQNPQKSDRAIACLS
jgi:hypothetical protein